MIREQHMTGRARMVVIGFLCLNCGIVMAPAAFGSVLADFQQEFHASRAMASAPISIMLLTLGLFSPIVGNLLHHISIRRAMMIGAGLNAAGFAIASSATHLYQVYLAFGLLIGPGSCLMGPVTVSTLISRWFVAGRGKALSIANMPLFMLSIPPVAALLSAHGGRTLLFTTMAAVYLALIPLLSLIQDHPSQHERDGVQIESDKAGRSLSNRELFGDPRFWLIGMGLGMITGSGTAFVTHAVPLAVQHGIQLTAASSIISAFGIGTLAGALLFGWLIDRIGSLFALAINAALQAALWGILVSVHSLPGLLIVACLFGCGQGSAVALQGATLSDIFGSASFSRAMGSSYFLKMPFIFGWTLLLGHSHDLFSTYRPGLLTTSALVAATCLTFLWMAWLRQRSFPAIPR